MWEIPHILSRSENGKKIRTVISTVRIMMPLIVVGIRHPSFYLSFFDFLNLVFHIFLYAAHFSQEVHPPHRVAVRLKHPMPLQTASAS